MTAHKHLIQIVRARMEKTGESYSSARRQVVGQASPKTSPFPYHFPGNIPATTALRVLLAHAGQPFSEELIFGIAGGIGAGVFSFYYEKEDHASFFVAGRHMWQDDVIYLKEACKRLGIKPIVQESGGEKAAEKQLRDAVAKHGPCIAWLDMAHLPHRALPEQFSGGGYHVITVYEMHDDHALVGDMTDEPIAVPLQDLAKARARIKKQKNRLLSIAEATKPKSLAPIIKDGLRACHLGLTKQRMANFTLAAFRTWGQRMHGSKDKESWERIFQTGPNLWRGLVGIYQYIEHYGTGGGLCRPMMAGFLTEAAACLDDPRLKTLSTQYADLGRSWSELAHAALPDNVPACREARENIIRRAELTAAGGPVEEIRQTWKGPGCQAPEPFPLSEKAGAELRQALQTKILALYEGEMAAHAALGNVLD
jgi:hypothetical protein